MNEIRKGQTSVESLTIFMIIILIGAVVIFGINQRNLNVQLAGESLQATEQAERLASAIDDAVVAGNGFERNVTIRHNLGPISIDEFAVVPNARNVRVSWTDSDENSVSVAEPIITSDINSTYTLTNQKYIITHSLIGIENIGGTIQIEGLE